MRSAAQNEHACPVGLLRVLDQGLTVVAVISAIASLVSFAVGLSVVLAIFVFTAKLAAIAVVGIIEAATRIRVEWFASERVLPGNRRSIAESKLARFMHAPPEAIVVVVAILVAIVVTVVIPAVLSGGKSNCARQNCAQHGKCLQTSSHNILLWAASPESVAGLPLVFAANNGNPRPDSKFRW